MKVYIVETYSGDDHVIEGVFDTQELADAYMECFNQDDRYGGILVTEMELNAHESYIKEGNKIFYVLMNKNGTVVTTRWLSSAYDTDMDNNGTHMWIDKKSLALTCFAKDEEHAIAKAEEIRKQIIWDGIWCD